MESNDKMRMTILHPGLKLGVFVTWRDVSAMTGEAVLEEIMKVLQSNENFRINDGQMTIQVTVVRLPVGSGRKPLHAGLYFESENMSINKRSIIQINNTKDVMCMARAVVVAKCNADKDDSETWKKNWHTMRQSDRPMQTREAMKLLDQAKIPHTKPCGIEEYKKIQSVLAPKYLIKVHSQYPKDGLIFPLQFKKKSETRVIHIYYNGVDHYDAITKVTGFLGASYYCEYCDVGYNQRGAHRCADGCEDCYSDIPCIPGQKTRCMDCKRTFRSRDCFAKHKAMKSNQHKSICQLVYNCGKCNFRIVGTKKNHVCPGQRKCRNCKEIVGPNHQCYIQCYECKSELTENEGEEEVSQPKKTRFIFFDFESNQETGTHQVNFCVAHKACDDCMDLPIDIFCQTCSTQTGLREFIFEGIDTLPQFCNWILGDENKGVTCIAHNFGGYDGQFILHYILEYGTVKPEVIMNGNTILRMKVGRVTFLDSYNFLHMRLANFPDTFGLTEMKKGYFPHLANTLANQKYVGPYFPVDMYNPGQMSVKDREVFLAWHRGKIESGAIFDFRQEMEEYCRSDVDILRRGCACFRRELINISGLDPLSEACTIAQACSKVWRKNHMPENSIAIIPPEGYPNQKNYSIKAVRWIQSEAKTRGIEIKHALNGGEQRINGHYVDGYHEESRTVFEFYGCYWHGCPTHFPDRNRVQHHQCLTMHQLYILTIGKSEELRKAGYQVVEFWECDYDKRYKEDPDFRSLVDSEFTNLDPLKPRDALFGGRTNSTKLYQEIDESSSEEIKYIDVCSLYPTICKYGLFPLGHPTIYSQENIDKDNIRQYCGLIKCKVLPPTNLYHPVLPQKCSQKLMFPLCRSCAEKTDPHMRCTHLQEEDRSFTGTWVTIELFEALDRGYKLLDVHEVWHFSETTQYDKASGEGGIFAGYIDTFLRIKQESSGYPDWCMTEQDKIKFRQDYFEAEGIRLENVEKNKGMRAIAKIMLNSLWGKLAQRENMTKTEYISEPSKFFDLVTNPNKIVKNVDICRENLLLVNWDDTESSVEPHACSNVIVAAFVTAKARLKLYGILEKLNERVLYFDTDSIIYHHKPHLWNPTIVNNRLGEWTDEVPNARIVKFVGMGPKNYGYEFVDKDGKRKSTCKVKGLTLDYNTSQVIHFDRMLNWVKGESKDFRETVNYHRIRKHKDKTVATELQSKTYRFTYTKRVIVGDGYTVPYGYLA